MIISIRFNQDSECFVCGCDDGFRVFNTDPLKQIQFQPFNAPVPIVEMLFRSNYLAFVGGDHPLTSVVIWDYSLKNAVTVLELDQKVLSVRLSRDRIVVVHDSSLCVFCFSDIPKLIFKLQIGPNPTGLCALSPIIHPKLAFPAYNCSPGFVSIVNVNDSKKILTAKAHNHSIEILAFNSSGTILATSSDKGTLIRLFNTGDESNFTLLMEFRRGSNQARISCINFSTDSVFLCVASNHSTIHVFHVQKITKKLRRVEKYLRGGGANVSFTRLHISQAESKDSCGISICTFDRNADSIIVLSSNGSYRKFTFDKKNGACARQIFSLFSEMNNNADSSPK